MTTQPDTSRDDNMTALERILSNFREMTLTERDKGTSFEN